MEEEDEEEGHEDSDVRPSQDSGMANGFKLWMSGGHLTLAGENLLSKRQVLPKHNGKRGDLLHPKRPSSASLC